VDCGERSPWRRGAGQSPGREQSLAAHAVRSPGLQCKLRIRKITGARGRSHLIGLDESHHHWQVIERHDGPLSLAVECDAAPVAATSVARIEDRPLET